MGVADTGNDIALRVQMAVPTGAGRAPVVGSGSLRTTSGGIVRADVTQVRQKAKIVRRHQYADVAEHLRRMVAERARSFNDRLETGRQLRISHTAKLLIQDKPSELAPKQSSTSDPPERAVHYNITQ